MLSVVGKIIKKEASNKRAEIVIDEKNGNTMAFQVRSNEIIKLVSLDTGQMVRIGFEISLSETLNKENVSRINNLILKEIIPLGY